MAPRRDALVVNQDIPMRLLITPVTEAKPLKNAANRQNPSNPAYKSAMDVVLRMGNLSLETKEAIVQQLERECAQTEEALDTLAGRYSFSTEETSAAAYGDATALAHYNSLPNVQLPNFYGNALEFPKWWQMFYFLVDPQKFHKS